MDDYLDDNDLSVLAEEVIEPEQNPDKQVGLSREHKGTNDIAPVCRQPEVNKPSSAPKEHLSKEVPGSSKECRNAVVIALNEKKNKSITEQLSDDELASHPRVKNLFNHFWEEKMQELNKGEKSKEKSHCIKSPSDTTIYAPAIQRTPQIENEVVQQRNTDVNELVSNFVDSVRFEEQQKQTDLQEKERRRSLTADDKDAMGFAEARTRTDRAVIEAEKFRASIAPPNPGTQVTNLVASEVVMSNNVRESEMGMVNPVAMTNLNNAGVVKTTNIPNIGSGVSDDDFFHLTCHIDPNLIHKIEKGEFVELQKLLPKEKLGNRNSEDNRLEWVQRDRNTFLVPAQRDTKISSFRKWEQAFRAYATIYCGANPQRSKEIWQYISVINTAAASYLWDNVYNNDITFRHLMAFNPTRSWAITYNQMWNLSMKDPIPRNNFSQGFKGGFTPGQVQNKSGNKSNNFTGGKKKSDYCWNFNKGVPCKFGSKCKFIERCKYCDSPSHGVHACNKLQKEQEATNVTNASADAK